MVIALPCVKWAPLANEVSPFRLIFFIFIYTLLCLLNFYKLATRVKLYLKNIDERVRFIRQEKVAKSVGCLLVVQAGFFSKEIAQLMKLK